MRYEKRTKAVFGAVWIFLCCVLGGCSLSFCGLTPGGKEELVFTCEEGFSDGIGEGSEVSGEMPEDKETDRIPEEAVAGQSEEISEALESGGEPLNASAFDKDSGKVNLNTAGPEELMTLNGIGKTRAEAILEYRQQHGPFTRIEDIMLIPGIKEGIFSKIREQITVH